MVWLAGVCVFLLFGALGFALKAPSAPVAAASVVVMLVSAVGLVKAYRASARRRRKQEADAAQANARRLDALLQRVDDPAFEYGSGRFPAVWSLGALGVFGAGGLFIVNTPGEALHGWLCIGIAVLGALLLGPAIGRRALVMNADGFKTPYTRLVPWRMVVDASICGLSSKGLLIGFSLTTSLGEIPRTCFRSWSIHRYSPARRVSVAVLLGPAPASRDVDFPLFCALCARADPRNLNFLIHLPEACRKKLEARLDTADWPKRLGG